MIVRRCLALCIAAIVGSAAFATATGAHEPGNSAVLIDIADDIVELHLQLPLEPLSLALDIELDPATVVDDHEELLDRYIAQHLSVVGADGTVWTATIGPLVVTEIDDLDHLTTSVLVVPAADELTDFTLEYEVILEEVITHDILVTSSIDGGDASLIATLNFSSNEVAVDTQSAAAASQGILDMIHFGFEHVLEGADHLLFLFVLLLPAPAIIGADKRWVRQNDAPASMKRVVIVASAFTVGHALTIALSAKGGVVVSSRPVEVLVALSVIAGAVHAWRPLARHGEVALAGGFGLVHGLAFAGLLEPLGLGTTSWATLAAFNLGVELAQLATICLTFPLIYLVSRTPFYAVVRTTLAALIALLAAGWVADRTGLGSNPFASVEAALIERPLHVLAALAVGTTVLHLRAGGASSTTTHDDDRVHPEPERV